MLTAEQRIKQAIRNNGGKVSEPLLMWQAVSMYGLTACLLDLPVKPTGAIKCWQSVRSAAANADPCRAAQAVMAVTERPSSGGEAYGAVGCCERRPYRQMRGSSVVAFASKHS